MKDYFIQTAGLTKVVEPEPQGQRHGQREPHLECSPQSLACTTKMEEMARSLMQSETVSGIMGNESKDPIGEMIPFFSPN